MPLYRVLLEPDSPRTPAVLEDPRSQDWSSSCEAGSADTDARDNTATTSTEKGVPIYWLNCTKAADGYEDFYDGSWDDEANDKNESGTNSPDCQRRMISCISTLVTSWYAIAAPRTEVRQ